MTTSDKNGLILQWKLCADKWTKYKSMVIDDLSWVRCMKWSYTCDRICIGASSGRVTVRDIKDNGIWDNTLDAKIDLIEWSSKENTLLLVSSQNEIFLFDNRGVNLAKITMITPGKFKSDFTHESTNSEQYLANNSIIAIEWNKLI